MANLHSKKSIIALYGVDKKTFEAWIEDIKNEVGWKNGRQVFTPKQSARIIEYLGEPSKPHDFRNGLK